MRRTTRSLRSSLFPFGVLAGAAWLSAGCGSAVGGEPPGQQLPEPQSQEQPQSVTKSVLDGEVLAAALSEQASMEAQGVSLRARAWLAADAYVTSYKTSGGATLGTQMIGKNSLASGLPTIKQNESLNDFRVRARLDNSLHLADLSTDTIWFTPNRNAPDAPGTPPASGLKTESSPLDQVAAALAACNDRANITCGKTIGYWDPQNGPPPATMRSWNRTGRGGATFSAYGSAGYAAVCAHGGGANFLWQVDSERIFRLNPESFVVQIPPLAFFSITVGDGYNAHDCGFLNAGCNFYYEFNQANQHFHVSQSSNGPIETFCGSITDHALIQYSSAVAFGLPGGPEFDYPGDVPINNSDILDFEIYN
jgi:hypothetical protein